MNRIEQLQDEMGEIIMNQKFHSKHYENKYQSLLNEYKHTLIYIDKLNECRLFINWVDQNTTLIDRGAMLETYTNMVCNLLDGIDQVIS
jgi:hypothetical protein